MRQLLTICACLALLSCDDENYSFEDAEEEEEPFVCTPSTPHSDCNAQYDCGCDTGMGEWCKWMFSATGCYFYEGCTPAAEGTGRPGEACDPQWHYPDPPLCMPGHVCIQYGVPETGVCARLCETTADCSAGSECGDAVDYIVPSDVCGGTPQPQPYRICSWL